MKKRLLIITLILSTFGSFAQEANLEFVQKKATNNGYTVYFQVENAVDQDHAEKILNDLLSDNNIYSGRYFKSGSNKDRYQLNIKSNVTATYIRNILLTNNVDYDYSTIIVNGVNPVAINNVEVLQSTKSNPEASNFPVFENTGNSEVDNQNYRNSKDEWIKQNPVEYQNMLKELENKNK
jgi:hypothetical protein